MRITEILWHTVKNFKEYPKIFFGEESCLSTYWVVVFNQLSALSILASCPSDFKETLFMASLCTLNNRNTDWTSWLSELCVTVVHRKWGSTVHIKRKPKFCTQSNVYLSPDLPPPFRYFFLPLTSIVHWQFHVTSVCACTLELPVDIFCPPLDMGCVLVMAIVLEKWPAWTDIGALTQSL